MSGRSPRKAASANTHAPTHAPVRRVAAEGDSSGWKAQKDNHSTIGDAFLAWIADNDADLSAKWGTSWDAVPESHACDSDIHAVAAGYLADVPELWNLPFFCYLGSLIGFGHLGQIQLSEENF